MKTALIHYWLVNNRGGEKVLSELAGLFPSADLFTHVYDGARIPPEIRRLPVRTTFISRLPLATKLYQAYLPLMPRALRRLDLDGYDLIISTESGPAKGICKPDGAVHICYCFTPMRYLWDMADAYYRKASLFKKAAIRLFFPQLRKEDLWSATQVDHFIADSRFVAERILRIYGRASTVIYPPVDVNRFLKIQHRPQGYFLFCGQLTDYKRADLAVEAFVRTGKTLVVAGDGDQLRNLRRKAAGSTIRFAGRVSDEELDRLYAGAEALIFPGIEDFGIVPVEAQAAGVPVIAFRGGGALETVVENRTGIFFDEPTSDSLICAMKRFEETPLNPEDCRAHAEQFSADRFRKEFRMFCENTLRDRQ